MLGALLFFFYSQKHGFLLHSCFSSLIYLFILSLSHKQLKCQKIKEESVKVWAFFTESDVLKPTDLLTLLSVKGSTVTAPPLCWRRRLWHQLIRRPSWLNHCSDKTQITVFLWLLTPLLNQWGRVLINVIFNLKITCLAKRVFVTRPNGLIISEFRY